MILSTKHFLIDQHEERIIYNKLLVLYSSILNGENETIQAATEELEEIFQQEDSIISHINFIQACENTIVRHEATLCLKRILSIHAKPENYKYLPSIQSFFIQQLQNEEVELIKKELCNTVGVLITLWHTQWDEIYQLANDFLQEAQYVAIGLYLWNQIFQNLDEKIKISLCYQYLDYSSKLFQNSDRTILGNALDLFNTVMWYVIEDEENDYSTFFSRLCSFAYSLFISQNPDEHIVNTVTEIFCNIVGCEIPVFSYEILDIFKMTMPIFTNNEIDVSIRVDVFQIIEAIVTAIHDEILDDLPEIIHGAIELSLYLCETDREDDAYEFCSAFLDDIIIDEQIFDLILGYTNQILSNSTSCSSVQVALMILTSILKELSTYGNGKLDDIIQMILQAGSIDDPYVVIAFCEAIKTLIDNSQDECNDYFESIVNALLAHANYQIIFQTIEFVITNIGRPSQFINQLISVFSGLIDSSTIIDTASSLLFCIASCLQLMVSDVDNNYDSLLKILDNALQYLELRGVSLFCLGFLAKLAPDYITSDLKPICEIASAGFDHVYEDESHWIIMALQNVILSVPIGFSTYLPTILPRLIDVIQLEEPDIPEMTIEYVKNCFYLSKSAAVSCIGEVLKMYPETYDTCGELIWEIISTNLRKGDLYFDNACQIIENCALIFIQHGKSFLQTIQAFIPQFHKFDNKTKLRQMILAIRAIVMDSGHDFLMTSMENIHGTTVLEYITTNLMLAISGNFPEEFFNNSLSQAISPILQFPIFSCLSMLAYIVGSDMALVTNVCMDTLQSEVSSKDPMIQAHVIFCYSVLCQTAHAPEDNIISLVNVIHTSINQYNKPEYQRYLLLSLCNFLLKYPSLYQEFIGFTKEIIDNQNNYSKEVQPSISCLWAISTIQYQTDVTEDDLVRELDSIVCIPNSYEAVTLNSFCIYVLKLHPDLITCRIQYFACLLFASRMCFVQLLPQEIINILVSYICELPIESIVQILKNNQNQARQVQINVFRLINSRV